MKTITVIELNSIDGYPPVQTLIRVFLNKGYRVNLIGRNVSRISKDILENNNYIGYETSKYSEIHNNILAALNRLYIMKKSQKLLKYLGCQSDYVWTTSMQSMQLLQGHVLKYKNILQLMELAENGYLVRERYVKFPIDKYARLSWKIVVPEINRAYIQKVWWNLPSLPYVLPNKPYSIDYGEITFELKIAIDQMEKERKKIILYLGAIVADRDLEQLANAVKKCDDYALYIVGKALSDEAKNLVKRLESNYNCVYLGGFNPPGHLALVQYARIGLLPYKPASVPGLSDLNALYCAPNKIWEYAGFGVPMVGSDVPGLKLPFEQWNIGRCCDLTDEASIIKTIEEVDRNHDEMSENCYKFYDSVDLVKIVSQILEDNPHIIKHGGVIRRSNIYATNLVARSVA